MRLSRIIPRKFSTRLFLATFIAGLIPVIIFVVLIHIYGNRIERAITGIIEKGYDRDMTQSAAMLREMGEASVYGQVNAIAQQLDMVIQSVPWMTVTDLQKDTKFREVAIQTVGRTGYTFVFDSDSGIVRFHRDLRMESKHLPSVFRHLPELENILETSLRKPGTAYGYYQLKAGDGNIMKRFIYIIPLHNETADRARLSVAATVNVDDFLTPVKQAEATHNETKRFLIGASKSVIESFRHTGLILMGIGILVVSLIAFFVMGIYLSRAVSRLREATARVNRGDLTTMVKPSGSGEVATLIGDFNRMVNTLAATTVSKQLLEASETKLLKANSELRREIAERERTEEALAAEKERLSAAQEELLQARKLESLGVLAGGIAHDFNNLLAVILGNISFGKMLLKGKESKLSERLTEAENACMRGKELTYQLLAFARGGEPLRHTVEAAQFIEDSVRSGLNGSDMLVSFSLREDLPLLRVDEGRMREAIQRIVKNAAEAVDDKGALDVGADRVTLDRSNPLALNPGSYVRISLRDDGPGIAQAHLQRIFDPYFTKKELGQEKGTGLGLSICYSIVKDHGGSITVESEEGSGSLFRIYLPAADRERSLPPSPAAAGATALTTEDGKGKKARLLFMDDDRAVRDVMVEMLMHLGYQVTFAGDGFDAIEEYQEAARSGRPFDVVIADLTVPDGMGGKELVRELQAIDPEVKTIISSGYSNEPVLRDFREYGFRGCLLKPYKIEELCAVLDRVMHNEPVE